jgi:hypothetical protein
MNHRLRIKRIRKILRKCILDWNVLGIGERWRIAFAWRRLPFAQRGQCRDRQVIIRPLGNELRFAGFLIFKAIPVNAAQVVQGILGYSRLRKIAQNRPGGCNGFGVLTIFHQPAGDNVFTLLLKYLSCAGVL